MRICYQTKMALVNLANWRMKMAVVQTILLRVDKCPKIRLNFGKCQVLSEVLRARYDKRRKISRTRLTRTGRGWKI